MIVPDINLLIYAYDTHSAHHALARAWWERALSGEETVGLALPVIFGFLRLATSPRVFAKPLPVVEALGHIRAWLAQPQTQVLQPGPRHLEISFRLIEGLGVAANLTTDAQLAALTIENQATLCSSDCDFARFPGLRWMNPLAR
jgi:toxin-antitoxin system PIN domain toxin